VVAERPARAPCRVSLRQRLLAQRAAGDREAAVATLEGILAREPRYATAHYLLGNKLAGDGAYAEAIRHYRRYLALEPNGPMAARCRERIEAARRAQ
jgi:tetratricopeptide (TPR) repeat protein